ncbi:MAG: CAP domain-containing protein [Deltaproteobacteria bacterium]|nr:CAP domain-containing protein [Deltaproteobacteria bacterium]
MNPTTPKSFLVAILLTALVLPGASWGQVWAPVPSPMPAPAPVPPPLPPGPGASILAEVEAIIYQFTNEIRVKHNFAPVARDPALEALARSHCQDMLQRRYFSHNTPEGLAPQDRVMPRYPYQIYRLGENIWKGFNQSLDNPPGLARVIVDGWMNSPGHRDNIFCPDFTHVGIGVAVVGRDIRATQLFANLRGSNPF